MDQLVTIKPELLSLDADAVQALLPFFIVIAGTLLATLACTFRVLAPKWTVFFVSLMTCAAGAFVAGGQVYLEHLQLFNGMMIADSYAAFFHVLILGSAFFTILASLRYLDKEQIQHPEYYALILFSVIGMMLMVSALDLIVIFIALEMMSLCVYMLVGFRRADRRSNEGSLKYFVLGGAASAVFLYGVALLYGSTGSTNIQSVLNFVETRPDLPLIYTLGAWLVIVGFLFKVASAPFHMWMPDVYEGAPTPVTGFMTTGLKAAAFATFLRVFVSLGYGVSLEQVIQDSIHDILWVSALLTIIVGNLVALAQTNLKRMLAYSSIAHTGYIMVGLIAGSASDQGYAPVLLYILAYAVMNLGAFVILSILSQRFDEGLNLQDLAGVARRNPWLAFSMAVFMFSMAGIPPTAGFVGKYLVFYSAVQAGEILLVVVSVLFSAVSVYYYLRVLVYMYMRDPVDGAVQIRSSLWASAAVAAMVILIIQVGILPARLIEVTQQVVQGL